MTYFMLALTVANVAQALIYHRLEGRFQTMFWFLALCTGGCAYGFANA